MRLMILAVLLSTLACTSKTEDSDESGGMCGTRTGSYLMKYTYRSGNCGDGFETVVNINQAVTSVPDECDGSYSVTPDNCQVTYESICPNDGVVVGGALKVVGKSQWDEVGSRGTATESWTIFNPNGTVLCTGTYDVLVTRQ